MGEQDVLEKLRKVFKGQRGTYHSDNPRSAVLVPLVQDREGLSILFEVRSSDLSWQPGDICFPGGRIESQDETPMAAAIRETSEELGISTSKITVLGTLNDIASNIGVMLFPIIGYISGEAELKPNEKEVAKVFTVPLQYLLAAEPIIGNMEMATRPKQEFPFTLLPNYAHDWMVRAAYQVYFYQYKEYVIWGLTAKVLRDFLENYRSELTSLRI